MQVSTAETKHLVTGFMNSKNFTFDVSIIIVNYNTKQLLADCLNSIYEQTKDISFEVIVSDNGSKDGSIEMLKANFPQVILIENNANLGFGAANNRGLSIARGKYIFYLNSDTILMNNAVKCFFDYWEENGEKENLGALGSILQGRNGENVVSGGSFLGKNEYFPYFLKNQWHLVCSAYYKALKHFIFHYELKHVTKQLTEEASPGFVDCIIGADLFLKNNNLALFDEHFFMYCEEVDLQYQMKKMHLNRKLIDMPKIIHLEGSSSTKISYEVLDLASFSKIHDTLSRLYFLKKNNFSFIRIFTLQVSTSLLWLNPLIFKQTKKYIRKLWQI